MRREVARAAMLSLACQGAVMPRATAERLSELAEPDDEFLEQLERARESRRRLDEANKAATAMLMELLGDWW